MTRVSWSRFSRHLVTFTLCTLTLATFIAKSTPPRRGFYCEDQTIRLPFHSSTVPTAILAAFSLGIPIFCIFLVEYLFHQNVRKGKGRDLFLNYTLPLWFICAYQNVMYFLLGIWTNELLTNIGKFSVGRLRPNFIDMCGPLIGGVKLTEIPCSTLRNPYINDYVCSKSMETDALQNRLSFPSGHAATSAYAMLYTVIFIQTKIQNGKDWGWAGKYKVGVQAVLMLLAYLTGLSRIMDHKHHSSDVLAGVFLGSSVALITARYVAKLFEGKTNFGVKEEAKGEEKKMEVDINRNYEN